MSKSRRSFSASEKLSVINEADQIGVTQTLRKPSKMTITQDGKLFDNTVVLHDVETILQQEFCCYGYKNVWDELKGKGYIINHKKVYRLMKINNLRLTVKLNPLVYPDNLYASER